MMSENKNVHFEEIKQKLRAFAGRYYLNNLLQNIAVFLAATALILLALSLIEYVSKNESEVRAVLFYCFLFLISSGFVYLVAIPGMKMAGLMKGMSEEELSVKVGKRLEKIDDKLLNVLLLEEMRKNQQNDFLQAAIDQKSKAISTIPFHLSASLKKGVKFLKYSLFSLVILMIMGMTFPDLFNYGTKRVVFYNSQILPPPPFEFIIQNELRAVKNESFEILVKVSGDVLPLSMFVVTNDQMRKALKTSQNEFAFTFSNVTNDFNFKLDAEGVVSKTYEVDVIERPTILNFDIEINYPAYLKKENEKLQNTGNLLVPEGSKIAWKINVNSGHYVRLKFGEKITRLEIKESTASFDSLFLGGVDYSIGATHNNGLRSDSISYRIRVIEDQHPGIDLIEQSDSLNATNVFIGSISDDYGLSAFRFAYRLNNEEEVFYKNLDFYKGSTSSDFLYELDWNKWDLQKGDEVSYYFEVWDNDGVNGPKSSRSRNMFYRLLDEEEIEKQKEELTGQIENEMEMAIEEAKELTEDIKELQKDLVEEKKIDWATKKKLEELIKRNESLKKTINEINAKNQQKNLHENNLKHSDEINRKREELDRLMNEILDDEMLEKLKELESLMEKLKKEELQKEMEEIEISNEQLENELDRSLELFKQLEFEMQLEKTMEELDEIITEQEDLRNNNEDEKAENLAEKQEELKKKFVDWEKEKEKLEDLNDKLENKHDVEDSREKQEGTKQDMDEAKENLNKGKKKKAAENQKGAEQKMAETKDDLNALKMSMQAQSMEDIQSLRNTLENLLELSFEQELLMQDMKGMKGNDPRFNEATREQRAILGGLSVVEDSLRALSKRIVQIQSTINKELAMSNMNMERSIRAMTERKIGNMSNHQQLSMTSLNNLAVLLDEVVEQLQDQMAQSKGQCNKPGNSKPSPSSMKSMQKELNKQIEKMKKMMENGENPGNKEGKKMQEAESLAKMAAEQAKIREELRKLEEGANQQDSKGYQKIGEMMEETERDIVNRQISRETLMRQERILTKLLESEKAERQQDMEERREAVSGEEKRNGNLFDVKEYYKTRYSNHEELIKQNIGLNRYYKERAEEYFKIIDQ